MTQCNPEFAIAYASMVELLRERASQQSNQRAFTFLADGETESDWLTYAEFDRRSRAIAAQLQALNLQGERALLLYPPGLDYLTAFFGCLYAGVVAVPAYPPRNARNTPRILSMVQDAEAAIALTTSSLVDKIQSLLNDYSTTLTSSASLLFRDAQQGFNPPILRDFESSSPQNWGARGATLQWLTTDQLPDDLANDWRELTINRDTLAFLQYTSGSTGTPKGVMVSHGNLLHNAATTYEYMGHTPESVFVSWLPAYHDMGLIGGILQPLYGGFPCVLMPPATFLQRPYRWLQAISRYKATTSGGPNFAYDLCVEKITPEQRQTLDLSSWKVAFNGAEPIRAETLERFAETFADCGFQPEAAYPCYGMAEATLMVSGVEVTTAPNVQTVDADKLEQNQVAIANPHSDQTNVARWVSCGRSIPDQTVVIVQPDTCLACAADQVGEIWVSGSSVGKGYWNRPQETQETFQAYVADTGAGPFLRTGDLGFLHQGELYITGRAKDLIIVRGRNLYPQDLERTAESSHPSLRTGSGAAFTVAIAGEEHLVVVQELEFRQKPDTAAVIQAIRQAVTEEHEIQVYGVVLVKAGTIPKTTSGKIQRRACRAAFLAGELTVVAQDVFTPTQATTPEVHLSRESLFAVSESDRPALLTHYLQVQIAQALQLDVQQIDDQQPLSSLGLDSLRVFSLRNQIETDLSWDIPIADLFSGITLAELVQQGLSTLEQAPVERQLPPLQPLSHVSNNYPLSFSQQRLRFLDQLDPGNPAYNIALVVQLQGGLDIAALTRSLNTIVQRHESLRTTFPMQQGQPVQVIAEALDLPLVQVDLQTYPEAEREGVAQQLAIAQLQQSFDLSQGPLVRATLLHLHPTEAWLVLAMHHIVSDGHSMEVLYQELTTLYRAKISGGSLLAPLPIQYKDFSHWQHQWLQGSVLEKQLTYWRQQLADATTALSLPSDRPRPAVPSFRGSHETCTISAELTQQLQELSRRSGVTLFMTLLAAWQTLLYRYSGQTDICVGTPIASRTQEQLNSLIGFFVNTLVLRTDLSGDPSFQELLQRVRQVALEAYAHQDLPFEQLVQALQPQRHTSYTPLFQVMLTLQSELPTQETAGLTWQPRSINGESAQFDLSLDVTLTARGMDVCLKYSTDLFDSSTIAAMLTHWQTLLAGICQHPEQPLSQLPLLTETERQQILYDWNRTHKAYPEVAGIHHLFEAQAESKPDAIAVIFGDTQLTYCELNQRANQLAHHLQQLGVKPDTLVGICVERSLEMVIGLLGILKAGGAYVPFDPSYPSERLGFMLQDAQVSILLTQQKLLNSLPPTTAQILCLDTDWEVVQACPSENLRFENQTLASLNAGTIRPPSPPILGGTGSQSPPELGDLGGNAEAKLTAFIPQSSNTQTSSSLAYVIYTSGSTGKPKGAMNTHEGICNRLLWMQDAYGLNVGDRVLQKTPFSFDVSVWEFFWPLMTGACLVVAPPNAHKDSAELVRLITQHQVTTLHFVPSMLRIFLNDPRVTACTSLRRVICSGEALAADLPPLFFQRLTAELHNLYGPTETAVDVTAWQCQPDWQEGTIPIGYPIANTQIYILDVHLQPVPVGVAGELYIGGVGVGRGYLNRPELTADKFIPNPFREGDRLYKTGDLARYRRDGSIEYLGRLDYQVKLRGLRIELGEIEAVLAQHPAVQTSVVVVRQLADQQQLVAYVVPESAAVIPEANDVSLATQLRQDLRQQLPDYMVPSVVMLLPSLPLTPNGKVDRRALPEPTVTTIATTSSVQPQTQLERLIAEVWQTVLQVPQVGLQDNFFDLGGHSLLMAQVQFQVQERIQQEVSVVDLFQYPTVQALAQYLSSRATSAETTQPVFQSVRDRVQKQKSALNRQRKFRNQG